MSKRTHTVALRLTDEEYDLFQQMAYARRWSMSSLANFIVADYLASYQRDAKKADHPAQLPLFVSPGPAEPANRRNPR